MARPRLEAEEPLIVGRVRRPHGVRGEVLIALETDRPRHVYRAGRALGLGTQQGQPAGGPIVVERMRPTTGGAILKVQGVESREAADLLRGHTLLMPVAEALPAAGEEIHFRDLVGLTALIGDAELGPVEDILELPSGETLVIRSGDGREVWVPFVKQLVVGIDLDRRELRLDLPEGYLEV